MLIEAIGLLFSIFALSRAILRFREGRMGWGMMIVWCVAWLTIMLFIISPSGFEVLSKAIGIQRPLDLMLIGGLMISFYLMFRIYVFVEELRSDLAKVVREVALGGDKKKAD
jgi:hypothetical protein